MNKSNLLKKGFKEVSHPVARTIFSLDVGCNRSITIGFFGTQSESVFLDQKDEYSIITDLVCLHNWEHNGILTEKKLELILSIFD